MTITRRRLITGAVAVGAIPPTAALAQSAFPQKMLSYLVPTIISPANAAVKFPGNPGDGSFPAGLVNLSGTGIFTANAHELDFYTTPWGFTTFMMQSITPPGIGQTRPIFGLNGVHGEVFKVSILPPGSYPIYPPGGNPRNGPVYRNFGGSVLDVYVANPNGAQSLFQRWYAAIPYLFDGVIHIVESFLNSNDDPVGGSTPFGHRVLVDNQEFNVYMGPGQNPRALNSPFEIPWGEDGGNPAPYAWVGSDYPIYGAPPNAATAWANTYIGDMDRLMIDPKAPVPPESIPNVFMSPTGTVKILPPDGANVLYPGQKPPGVYLHGSTSPRGFRYNQGGSYYGDVGGPLDTRFNNPSGEPQVIIEHIDIGGPGGGDP